MTEIEPTIYNIDSWLAGDVDSNELPVYDVDGDPISYQYSKQNKIEKIKSWITGEKFVPQILAMTNDFDVGCGDLLSLPDFKEHMVYRKQKRIERLQEEEEIRKANFVVEANERYADYLETKSPENLERFTKNMRWTNIEPERFEYMTNAHSDKEVISAMIETDYDAGEFLSFASKDILSDRDLVMRAISREFKDFDLLPQKLKDDIEVFRAICAQDGNIFEKGNEIQKLDRVASINAASICTAALEHISSEFINDVDFQTTVLGNNQYALKHMPDSVKNDKDVVAKACFIEPDVFLYASDELKNDKEFLSQLCNLENVSEDQQRWKATYLKEQQFGGGDGSILEFASPQLLCDKEFMLSMISQDGLLLLYASDDLKKDRDIVLAAINEDPYALSFAAKELNNDSEIYGPALQESPGAFRAITDYKDLAAYPELVLQSAKDDGESIQWLNLSGFPDDKRREIVLEAMKTYTYAFSNSTEQDRDDYDFVKAALQINAREYSKISDELKTHKDLAAIALKNNPRVFEDCIASIRDDRNLTLLAVSGNGYNLAYAGESLRRDKEVCLAAINDSDRAMSYVDKSLYDNLDIATAFFKKTEYANPAEYFNDDGPKPEYPRVAAILKAYPEKNPEDAIPYHVRKLQIDAERLLIEKAVPEATVKQAPEVVEKPKMRMKI